MSSVWGPSVMAKCVTLAVAFLVFSNTAAAAQDSDWRTVRELGCHRLDGTCFVAIDGAAVSGGSGCTSNLIRWDSKGDGSGKNWLALFMLAKATGKRVRLYVDGCYVQHPTDPTFSYGFVEP
jgi:hypothetical protein